MESYVDSCYVLRTGRILQVNSSNGMGFIDCPELKVVWLRLLECWNVDGCCARQFLATTFMCTGIRCRKCRGFMQNQSLPFLEVGAFPIGTEVNFAILLSKDWVAFNFCSDTMDIHVSHFWDILQGPFGGRTTNSIFFSPVANAQDMKPQAYDLQPTGRFEWRLNGWARFDDCLKMQGTS